MLIIGLPSLSAPTNFHRGFAAIPPRPGALQRPGMTGQWLLVMLVGSPYLWGSGCAALAKARRRGEALGAAGACPLASHLVVVVAVPVQTRTCTGKGEKSSSFSNSKRPGHTQK